MLTQVTYKDIIRFTLEYWRRRPLMGWAALGFWTAAILIDTLIPIYVGKIIDAVIAAAQDKASMDAALIYVGIFFGLGACFQILRWAGFQSWIRFALGNLHDILTESMHKVQRFSSDWHANSFAGATVRKITRGMWAFDMYGDTLYMGLYPALLVMIAMSTMLVWKLPLVGFFAIAMIVIYVTASVWLSIAVLLSRFKESAEKDTAIGASLADIITGNPTVKAFGAEEREDNVFNDVASDWRKKAHRSWTMAEHIAVLRGFIREIMLAGMLGLTVWMWSKGQATVGDIALALNSFFIINGYLRDVGMHITNLQKSISEMEDVISYWLREDKTTDKTDAKAFVPKDGQIVFDKVGFAYANTDERVYDNLSLEIAPGEKVALVGASGSGKSTFVKLLLRLYDIDDGAISVDGQNIADVTQASLRSNIALVPQEPILFHRSLAENIAYGRPDASMDEIIAAAEKAYAHDFIAGLSDGYNTLVGERGIKLSGGERQRVAIARAILADTPILILDEATSALDSLSEYYIQRALDNAMEGKTTITIAHRLSTIKDVDRILVFEKGQIIEQGSHNELVGKAGSRYRQLWDMQASGLKRDEKAKAKKSTYLETAAE